MNKTLVIIIVIVIALFLFFKFGLKTEKPNLNNNVRPNKSLKPQTIIPNDKIVIVKNVDLEKLKQAISQFCNVYNQEQYVALPRLIIDSSQYIIIFPYDITFERFCYFINYLKYPHDIFYKPDIIGWCTMKAGDEWITDEMLNKKVMLFIPQWDDEYDNVYLTTEDNIGFKMGFALGYAHKNLDKPIAQFKKISIDLSLFKDNESIDYE